MGELLGTANPRTLAAAIVVLLLRRCYLDSAGLVRLFLRLVVLLNCLDRLLDDNVDVVVVCRSFVEIGKGDGLDVAPLRDEDVAVARGQDLAATFSPTAGMAIGGFPINFKKWPASSPSRPMVG